MGNRFELPKPPKNEGSGELTVGKWVKNNQRTLVISLGELIFSRNEEAWAAGGEQAIFGKNLFPE